MSVSTVVGGAWWVLGYAWGWALTGILLLFPLGAAIALDRIVEGLPPLVLLAFGVGSGLALRLPPWDLEDRISLIVVLAAVCLTWLGWNLLEERGSAPTDLLALLPMPLVVALGQKFLRRRADMHGRRLER